MEATSQINTAALVAQVEIVAGIIREAQHDVRLGLRPDNIISDLGTAGLRLSYIKRILLDQTNSNIKGCE